MKNELSKSNFRNLWAWVPTLYFAEGLPYVAVMTISVIMYKRLGLSNTEIALYTRDRKSTRLNSSHVRISYAVFCLKKKKNKKKKTHRIKKKKKKKKKTKQRKILARTLNQ